MDRAAGSWRGWLIAALVLAVLFGLLTWSVVAGAGPAGFDDGVERAIVQNRVGWATALFKALTWLGSSAVLWPVVGVVALVLWLVARRWREATFLLVAFTGANLLTGPVKTLVGRARPTPSHFLIHVTGLAYPSGHAMDSLAAALALFVVLAPSRGSLRYVALASAVGVVALVGWSRLYLGVHWLTDVIGGWLLAGSWVCLVAAALRPREGPARTERYPPGPGR